MQQDRCTLCVDLFLCPIQTARTVAVWASSAPLEQHAASSVESAIAMPLTVAGDAIDGSSVASSTSSAAAAAASATYSPHAAAVEATTDGPASETTRQLAYQMLAALRRSPLTKLTITQNQALQRTSVFDTVPTSLKTDLLAAMDADSDPLLRRARGAMVGMAIADSLGHNFGALH
jgi:hypothetical protein